MPPGSARKASARSVIFALRSCIVSTRCELGQTGVRDFEIDQRGRDDAVHPAAGRKNAVGDQAHQAQTAAAINQVDAAADHGCRGRAGCFGKPGRRPQPSRNRPRGAGHASQAGQLSQVRFRPGAEVRDDLGGGDRACFEAGLKRTSTAPRCEEAGGEQIARPCRVDDPARPAGGHFDETSRFRPRERPSRPA